MIQQVLSSLPRIKVNIGHIPQRLKLKNVSNPQARLEVLRKLICRLLREERCELQYNKAAECRQYMERLIQLGVHYKANNEYTLKMMRWWLIEQDLITKMFSTIVPRLKNISPPYTMLYKLPKIQVMTGDYKRQKFFKQIDIAILELKENSFPTLAELENERQNALKLFVKEAINERRYK